MGAGADTRERHGRVAAGVSEDEIAAHLASLDKKPCTVYYSPFSNNSMGAAMTATACGCAELKLVDLAGEQKSDAYLANQPLRPGAGPHRRQQRIQTGREPRDPKVPRHPVQAVFVSRQPREPRAD